MREWFRRQRAQQWVNWGAVHWVDGTDLGTIIATADDDLPFHAVPDVFLAGHPSVACRMSSLPFDIFREFLPFDPRGMTKRFLRQGLSAEHAVPLDKALCLSDWWFENYWHWLFEKLPKVHLAEGAGFDGVYIVPPQPYCAESLRLMGIADQRIVVQSDQTFRIGSLWMSPRLPGEALVHHLPVIDGVRRKLMAGLPPSSATAPKRLYLSRRDGRLNGRQVTNEADLSALLTRYGFQDYVGDGKSLAQQIADFAQAEAVIGPHGAAFSNLLFAPPGSLVIEAFGPDYIFHHIHPAVRLLGLRHYGILGNHDSRQAVPKKRLKRLKNAWSRPKNDNHSLTVDLDLVQTILDRELPRQTQ